MTRFMFIASAAPLTGVYPTCNQRVKVTRNEMLWQHHHRQREPSCPGSGQPPRAGSAHAEAPVAEYLWHHQAISGHGQATRR